MRHRIDLRDPIAHHVQPNPRKPEIPATHPKGRVCNYPGCTTILSIYNPDAWCAVHDRWHIMDQLNETPPCSELA